MWSKNELVKKEDVARHLIPKLKGIITQWNQLPKATILSNLNSLLEIIEANYGKGDKRTKNIN